MRALFICICIGLALFAGIGVQAATPVLIPFSCPGGGQGWTVFEDRNGDGNFDWQTTRHCNGQISAGTWPPTTPPPPPSNPRGIVTTSPPVSIDFSYQSCESTLYRWEVTEKDGSNNPTAYVSVDCVGTLTISYPSIFRPDTRGDKKILPHQPEHSKNSDIPVTLFPNPTMVAVNLSAELGEIGETEEYIVSVIDVQGRTRFYARVQGVELVSDYLIDVGSMTAGTYTVNVQTANGTKVAEKPLSVVK